MLFFPYPTRCFKSDFFIETRETRIKHVKAKLIVHKSLITLNFVLQFVAYGDPNPTPYSTTLRSLIMNAFGIINLSFGKYPNLSPTRYARSLSNELAMPTTTRLATT